MAKPRGNPRLEETRAVAVAASKAAADRFAANICPIVRGIQANGITSLRGIARALTARGVPTARGGTWTAVQVSLILRRLEPAFRDGLSGDYAPVSLQP
jgi:hypothetical protein